MFAHLMLSLHYERSHYAFKSSERVMTILRKKWPLGLLVAQLVVSKLLTLSLQSQVELLTAMIGESLFMAIA